MLHTSQKPNTVHRWTGTNAGKNDNVLLLALKAVDSVKVDSAENVVPEFRSKCTAQLQYLRTVRRDNPDPMIKIDVAELTMKSVV